MNKDNLQVLHRHCHDEKTIEDLKVIKAYKSLKEWKKGMWLFNYQFDHSVWKWTNDLPTLVNGTHTEPDWREAGCGESRTSGFEDESGW